MSHPIDNNEWQRQSQASKTAVGACAYVLDGRGGKRLRAIEGAAVIGRKGVGAVGQHGRRNALRLLRHSAPHAVLVARVDRPRSRKVRYAV